MAVSELQVDKIMDIIAFQRTEHQFSDTLMGFAGVFVKANQSDKRDLHPSAVRLVEKYQLERILLNR